MTTMPITQRERELGAIITAYNEVTERLKVAHERLTCEVQRLRVQLEEKDRELARRERLAALGEMAAGLAHEIRNPLAGIQLYASLLQKELGDRSESRGLAERISGGVQALEGIVHDVLAFAGDAAPQVGRVVLGAALEDCLSVVEPVRAKRAATIDVADHVSPIELRADAGQLQRALLNLLFNALEAAGDAGRVWVAADETAGGDFVAVRVADDGPGIPAELRQRIFHPFFTTKDSGTGLGLAIVHRIAEANGGKVRAAERVGGGAEMILTLPRWRHDE